MSKPFVSAFTTPSQQLAGHPQHLAANLVAIQGRWGGVGGVVCKSLLRM